jgi:hypothetical protein
MLAEKVAMSMRSDFAPVDFLDELMLHALILAGPELHLLHYVGREGRDVDALRLCACLTDLKDQRQMRLD